MAIRGLIRGMRLGRIAGILLALAGVVPCSRTAADPQRSGPVVPTPPAAQGWTVNGEKILWPTPNLRCV